MVRLSGAREPRFPYEYFFQDEDRRQLLTPFARPNSV